MPPMKAPTMPTTMSVNTPEPPPRTSCEASQPDTSPTNSQTITISNVMTSVRAYRAPDYPSGSAAVSSAPAQLRGPGGRHPGAFLPVSYTHLRAHETPEHL